MSKTRDLEPFRRLIADAKLRLKPEDIRRAAHEIAKSPEFAATADDSTQRDDRKDAREAVPTAPPELT